MQELIAKKVPTHNVSNLLRRHVDQPELTQQQTAGNFSVFNFLILVYISKNDDIIIDVNINHQ